MGEYVANIGKILSEYWDVFLITGVGYTLLLSVITVGLGAILGVFFCLGRMSHCRPLNWLVVAIVEVVRGTPMLLQLYVGYFLIPQLLPFSVSDFACIAIALIINSAAYVSEVFRSGIQAVDKGQSEAARSLGLSSGQTMLKIILPQAIKNILPALGNEFITTVKTELLAGLTTFMALAYILAINPIILSDCGMDSGKVFTATALASAIATMIMGLAANYPIVLSSAMGLNAYFAYSVCLPLAADGVENPWQIALMAVFCEGIIFILLSFCNFREKLVNDVPYNLKCGITAGIGLFITFIALKNAGVIANDDSTLVTFGNIASPEVALALIGLIITAFLYSKGLRGALLLGMLATWALGIIAQLIGWYDASNGTLLPSFAGYSIVPDAPYFFSFNTNWIGSHILDFCVIIFSFLFVDLFDTVGTLIGIASKADLLEDGKLPRAKQALLSDAIGTTVGAVLGTSTVGSYVESASGVSAGGRTGLTAVTASALFIIAMLFAPIFTAIPTFATTPVLVFVGLLMMASVKNMTFENSDMADILGGFLAIIMMPFTYSVAYGIMFGILSWVVLKIFSGKIKEIPGVMWIAAALFVLKIVTMI